MCVCSSGHKAAAKRRRQSVRRFLFLVSRHVNSTLDSKHGCKGGAHNAKSRSWWFIAPLSVINPHGCVLAL